MRTSSSIGRLPYAIVVRCAPLGQVAEEFEVSHRKDLRRALDECRRAAIAWAQLIGAQYPVLFWHVIDRRSGARQYPTHQPERGASNGTHERSGHRLF